MDEEDIEVGEVGAFGHQVVEVGDGFGEGEGADGFLGQVGLEALQKFLGLGGAGLDE